MVIENLQSHFIFEFLIFFFVEILSIRTKKEKMGFKKKED
jgi:hypothetical protein